MKYSKTLGCIFILISIILGATIPSNAVNDIHMFIDASQMDQTSILDITWEKHMIEEDISHASGIYSCDIDQDDDIDVIACGAHDNEVAYWENNGELPFEWIKHSIDDAFTYPMDVICCDIEGDGDIDAVGAAWEQSEIALWKPSGSYPIRWTKQIIKNNYPGAHEVYVCDFDKDGDMDVFGASAGLNRIDWWRNDGGQPIQWTEQTIAEQFGGARSMVVVDIDNDSDLDVIGASFTDHKVSYWINDGGDPIQWTEFIIDDYFEGAHFVTTADVDADGKPDVLGAAYHANVFAWWRNEGGSPISWSKQIIDSVSFGAMKICVADIDLDGDQDVIGSASRGNRISWWAQEPGDTVVWEKHTIDGMCAKAWPIYPVDLDMDGDMDVLGGSESSGGIMWYENSLFPTGDLHVEGSLVWNDISPGSVETASLTIQNIGLDETQLSWKVVEYPSWGEWTCTPESGVNILSGEEQIIEIEVIAPDESNQEFSGSLKIVNQVNPTDYCTIDVSLSTPRNRDYLIDFSPIHWVRFLIQRMSDIEYRA